jgi:hypothetical protein
VEVRIVHHCTPSSWDTTAKDTTSIRIALLVNLC